MTFSMDKTTLARLYVSFIVDGDEEFLRAVPDDSLDNVSGQRGSEIWRRVRLWIAESFGDPRAEVHLVAAEGDRVIVWLTVHATHIGSAFPWLQGRPASGQRIAWRQVHIFRVHGEVVVEHWAVRDDLRVLESIDAVG